MPFWLIVMISAVTSGMIASGGVLLASVAERAELSRTTLLIATVTGLVTMAKDIQSHLDTPPVMKRIQQQQEKVLGEKGL